MIMRPNTTFIYLTIAIVIQIAIAGCGTEPNDNNTSECSAAGLMESFITPDGTEVFIYEDGKAYIIENGSCTFAMQYFDPDFISRNYTIKNSEVFINSDDGLFPTRNNFFEDFENYSTFTDLFTKSIADTLLYWSSFTLQSPSAPEIADYVALRKCILNGTCTFIDNRIDLVQDPTNSSNTVLKFTSLPPTDDMITAKSSITSQLNYYLKDSEVWFEADYYIESGMPFSIVDFENGYFDQSPGPRVVVRSNKLAIENKFGAKLNYTQTAGIPIPSGQWFTVKVHFKYSNDSSGVIELWQDGTQLISTTGINLPTSNSVQNRLEVGVTATPIGCILLLDNMRISETPF